MSTEDSSGAAKPQPPGDAIAAQPQASHDTATPQALLDFMVKDWAPRGDGLVETVAHLERFIARRRALSKAFPGETLVVPTGHEKVRANDTMYRFRPGSDFYYLTGNTEPDCVLVMTPHGSGHKDVLFVEPTGREDATFFTDRNKGELWVGPRLGVPQSQIRYGMDECHPIAELQEFLGTRLGPGAAPARILRGYAPEIDARLAEHDRDKQLASTLSEQRLIKDAIEIAELERAIDATKRGFEDVIARLPRAQSEREVEGVFYTRARVEGNDVGYGTIAASGAHACILHWTRNDGQLRHEDLLLLDAGVEAHTLYTADITRTVPISGRFTPEQRLIYDLVLRAQRESMAMIRPGIDFMEPNRHAMRVLAQGLASLGILRVSVEEALREDRQLYRRWTLHNISHMLGLDVHDCAKARQEAYKFGKLKAGMVLTVEPGLYFQEDDLTVPSRFRGIGVRIEDDVLVTDTGYRNLSAHIPTGGDEVEAWMTRVWRDR